MGVSGVAFASTERPFTLRETMVFLPLVSEINLTPARRSMYPPDGGKRGGLRLTELPRFRLAATRLRRGSAHLMAEDVPARRIALKRTASPIPASSIAIDPCNVASVTVIAVIYQPTCIPKLMRFWLRR
jgi:hypothetical protein